MMFVENSEAGENFSTELDAREVYDNILQFGDSKPDKRPVVTYPWESRDLPKLPAKPTRSVVVAQDGEYQGGPEWAAYSPGATTVFLNEAQDVVGSAA